MCSKNLFTCWSVGEPSVKLVSNIETRVRLINFAFNKKVIFL